MKNNTSALSAQLDTQIASVEAALEINSKRKILRVKVEELLEQVFPCGDPDEGHDWVNDAMEFFRFGVEDVLLEGFRWPGYEVDEVDPVELKEFFDELGCPRKIAYDRPLEKTPVLDELISEVPDEMDHPVTEKELRAFFSGTRDMLKKGSNEAV